MPNYSYECIHCHKRVDAFQKITEAPLEECPHCKKKGLKREIGGKEARFFKGSGESSKASSDSCSCCSERCPHSKR